MYSAILYSIGKTKDGKYIVHLLVNYHDLEEECTFRYDRLADIPRYLISIEGGKVKYNKHKQVWVSHPYQGGDGVSFEYLYEKNDDCECVA